MDPRDLDGGGAGRREKFDLKDEQKVLAAAHLGDRRERGASPQPALGISLPLCPLSLSLWQRGYVRLQETQASSPESHSRIRKKIAGNSLPHRPQGRLQVS